MLTFLRRLRGKLRLGSLERGDFSEGGERPVENVDAMAAGVGRGDDYDAYGDSNYPPGYVKAYDEGRPRK